MIILCAAVELELGLLVDVNETGADSVCESGLGLIIVGDFDGGDSLVFSVDEFMSMASDNVVALWSFGLVLRIVANCFKSPFTQTQLQNNRRSIKKPALILKCNPDKLKHEMSYI